MKQWKKLGNRKPIWLVNQTVWLMDNVFLRIGWYISYELTCGCFVLLVCQTMIVFIYPDLVFCKLVNGLLLSRYQEESHRNIYSISLFWGLQVVYSWILYIQLIWRTTYESIHFEYWEVLLCFHHQLVGDRDTPNINPLAFGNCSFVVLIPTFAWFLFL